MGINRGPLRRQLAAVALNRWLCSILALVSAAAIPLTEARAAGKIAVIDAGSSSQTLSTYVQAQLIASGQFDTVDVLTNPLLGQMQEYCGVLVFTDIFFSSHPTFGDVLADYVDGGGGVLVAMFGQVGGTIAGRFSSANYWAIQPGSVTVNSGAGLGTIYQPAHPILDGVDTLQMGIALTLGSDTLHPSATRIADWSGAGSIPLIATRTIGGRRRVDLGFFPVSGDNHFLGWDPSTDGGRIVANSMSWVCAVCGDNTVGSGEACDDGNLVDGDGCDSNCTLTACGNGIITTGEGCDDGNAIDSDCCSNACVTNADGSPCSDGIFCNGPDTCSAGACDAHAGDPCAAGSECNDVCNENSDSCLAPIGTACADDGNLCTSDYCDGSGTCVHPNDNFVPCNDGSFCNGQDYCYDGSCSYHIGDPCFGFTCNDRCDEVTANCLASTSGTVCFDDGFECTSDQCDGAGTCTHPPIPGCSTRTPTATRTRTPTRTATGTATATLTPSHTRTPTPQPAPAALILHRVRLKADTSARPTVRNGSAAIRAEVNANAPFDGLVEEITGDGVAVRIATNSVEMTLAWPASSCSVRASNLGDRVTCDVTDSLGRRKLTLRPTTTPNFYSMRVVAKQLGIASPRTAAPVRVVLITKSFARQDDIYECAVSGASSRVSLCIESGTVATPTPGAPLGERLFSVHRPGSALFSSIVPGLDVSRDPWLPTTLRLRAGIPDVDGVASLELAEDAIVGLHVASNQILCMKIYAADSHGTIDCDGGTPYDILSTWDSNGAGPPGPFEIYPGLGADAGPGGATLFAGWQAFLVNPPSTISDCAAFGYPSSSPLYTFTTATSTGMFLNPVQGGTVSVSAQGQNFDCATWTQENGAGRLLVPLIATDTIVGDIANMLSLSDPPATQPPPAPTITPTAIP